MGEPVRYEVDLADRVQHLVRVRVSVPDDVLHEPVRLVLPVWTPGSYVVRNYVHHVQWVRATAAGAAVPVEPDGHSAWLLPAGLRGPVEFELELYANDLSVRTSHVDDHHALLIPPAMLPFVEAARDRAHTVEIHDDSPVVSLLPATGESTWRADDYDHLVDSAFEVGHHPVIEWSVAGITHRFVWAGHQGAPDFERITADGVALCGAAVDLFGGDLPVTSYTFLCTAWDQGGGGLEHRDGATLMVPSTTFQDPDAYARFQSLLTHEYLHLWNVKRLVPADLVRPDYERPVHTTSLWVAEGWTSYYDELLPLRAGCWRLDRYLRAMADLAQRVTETPGHRYQSLHEASHQAWVKHYIRDENSINAGTDYYGHGALVAWLLDLTIRSADPASGLDAAMRLLWERHGRSGQGYTEADVRAAVFEVAGRDLSVEFDAHVLGRELPELDDLVGMVGLRLEKTVEEPATPLLGIRTGDGAGEPVIQSVLRDGPAWSAGVTGGDRLLAVDGHAATSSSLTALLRAHKPGDLVELSLLRGPRLLALSVELGAPAPHWSLVTVSDPSAAQRAAFWSWTGQDHPGLRAGAEGGPRTP